MSSYMKAPPYLAAIMELAKANRDVVVVSQDFSAGLFSETYPERHFDVGISEQNLVGVAAGLAHTGKLHLRPWHGAVRLHARLRTDSRRLRLQPQQREDHRPVHRP